MDELLIKCDFSEVGHPCMILITTNVRLLAKSCDDLGRGQMFVVKVK